MADKEEQFGSRAAVIMAMAGSAIGLGNIWRFPYMVGEHGGAAFVVIYIIATLLISLPVFIAEVTVGRRSRLGAYSAMSALDPTRKIWRSAGLLAIAIPLLIDSYYSVIGGWSLEYLVKACTGQFVNSSPDEVSGLFGAFISSDWMPVIMHLIFLGICAFIVGKGVKTGIETFSKISIPILFILIVAMIVYSVTLPGAKAGVEYLIKPDFSSLNTKTCAYAMGQSFYSLSLGMGAIITYGSYVHRKENILFSSAGAAVSDLCFAILAGLAIMPAVFSAGIEPGAGPGLIFQSIPYIFASFGETSPVISSIVATIFFLAIVVAAITSCISLIEVGVTFLRERYNLKRWVAVVRIFLFCGGLGVLCSLSFGPLSGFKIGGMCLFDLFDWFCSNILLLVLAFITVIFVGFVMKKDDVKEEITNAGLEKFNVKVFPVLYFLIKWVAPVAIALILVSNFVL